MTCSLQALVSDISVATGVSEQNILLFLEDGRELRSEVIIEARERGGHGSPSSVCPSLLQRDNLALYLICSPYPCRHDSVSQTGSVLV